MKTRTILYTISLLSVTVAMIVFAGKSASSASSPMAVSEPADDERAREMAEQFQRGVMRAQELSRPGEHHKHLSRLAGTWDENVTMWFIPGSDPVQFIGTTTYEWVLNGRFLKEHGRANVNLMGQQIDAVGFLGYDNFRNEYTMVGMSNMGTAKMISRGDYDAQENVFTWRGMHDDVIFDRRDVPYRIEFRFNGENEMLYKFYTATPEGKEHLALRSEMRRRAGD